MLQRRQSLSTVVALDGQAEAIAKLACGTQKPRHQEVEQRPQLFEIVLHGRSRETQPMPSAQSAHGARRLTARVLDRLGFVQHQVVEGVLRQQLAIPHQHRIGGDDNLGTRQVHIGGLPLLSVDRQHPEVGSEASKLSPPIADEARRHDDQARPIHAPRFFLPREQCDRLQRLAQAHVVRQDAARVQLAQVIQPGKAFVLIGPKLGAKGRRRRRPDRPARQSRPALYQLLAGVPAEHEALLLHGGVELAQGPGTCRMKAQLPALLRPRLGVQIGEHRQHPPKPLPRNRHEAAVADGQGSIARRMARQGSETGAVRAVVYQLDQRRQQVHAATVHLHAELQAEPVGVFVGGLDLGVPIGAGVDHSVWIGLVDLDLPTELRQLRQSMSGERAYRVHVVVDVHQIVGLRIVCRHAAFQAVNLHGAEAF